MSKVLTNYAALTDLLLEETAGSISKGCTGNANFIFTNELTKLNSAKDDYHTKLAALNLGGPMATAAKNEARALLEGCMKTICTQINLQAGGNILKLTSSGAPLEAEKKTAAMPKPTGLVVKQQEVSGSVKLSVPVPEVHDHGTIFAYTLEEGADPDINNWKNIHANKHSLDVSGLTRGKVYLFAAAYKGQDGVALVWSNVVTMMVV